MAFRDYPRPAQFRGDMPAWTTNLSTIVRTLLNGRLNVVGEFTISGDDESTSTTVEDLNCHSEAVAVWSPMDSNAAGIMASLYIAADDYGDGEFTVRHPVLPLGTTYQFRYVLMG